MAEPQPAVSLQNKMLATHASDSGVALFHQGKIADAMACYQEALACDPNCAAAFFNLGMAYFTLGRKEVMWEYLNRALQLEPRNADFLQKLSIVYKRQQDFTKAIDMAQKAVELQPNAEDAWMALADAYRAIGHTDTARGLYQHVIEKFPHNAMARLELAWLMPPIPSSQAEIDALRAQVMGNLDQLIQQGFHTPVPNTGQEFPFYQAYHGRNNVALMKKLSEFFLACCPDVHFTAPHCRNPRKRVGKRRIGIVSYHMQVATLNQFFLKIIEGLAQDSELEVILFSTLIDAGAHDGYRHITITTDLASTRNIIAREELDILMYLEVGMSNQSYFLALARLAPVQAVWYGHPLTTGIPTIDYFFSTRAMETEGAQAHYTEKLVLLDHPMAAFARPSLPQGKKSREELGLPAGDVHLYSCPVMLFKLHPDMDRVFHDILAGDAKARIVLFDSQYKTQWRSQLQKRFAKSMPADMCQRILFLPFAPQENFFHILRAADAVLDPLHYSFGTTAYLALGVGVPFVTWPGEFLRGRVGAWMYRRMEIEELVASSPADYAQVALRLANDKDFYTAMAEKINARNDLLFNDTAIVGELAGYLKTLDENIYA